MYISTATAQDGHTHTCTSNSSNSCNFTDLHCGETYAVTVVTIDRGCWSKPSSAVNLRTGEMMQIYEGKKLKHVLFYYAFFLFIVALCPPANFTGDVSCDRNTLTLTWSPVTGATYILETVKMNGTSSPSEHPTTNTSHTLSSLLCGQRYAFRIAAQDGSCRSSYSPPMEISTGTKCVSIATAARVVPDAVRKMLNI